MAKKKHIKNEELTLSLIELDGDKDVVVCISGNYHKINKVEQLGGKILLGIEGSMMCIEREFSEYLENKYPKTTFVESVGKDDSTS